MFARKMIAEKLLWETLRRWNKTSPELDRIQFLKTVPFFNELSNWQLKKVGEIFFERTYDPGEMIFEQGQPGAAIFLIMDGQVSVEIIKGKSVTGLAVLEKGAFFGEMALLDEAPRSASARSLEVTKTLALYRNDLSRLINTDPLTACHIYCALARIVGDRLRSTNELVQHGELVEKLSA
jgi:CRP/FNR family transcriptional regulator, cyclic AMP receptor protein